MLPEAVTLLPNFLLIRGDVIPLPGGGWLNTLQGLTVPLMANAFSIFLLRQFSGKSPLSCGTPHTPRRLWPPAVLARRGRPLE